MRKLIIPSVLCLLLGSAFAVAQTVTKAIQLSQDATGAFTVDSFFGVTFPGHIFSNSTGQRPLPSIAGTGSPSLSTNSTDTAGTITMGTSATTATVTFGTAYGVAPNCVASWQSGNATSSPTAFTPVTTSIAFTQTSTSANKISYFCVSPS